MNSDKPIILMVGTRPEAIKMIPVYFALKKANLQVRLCSSGQHSKLLNSVFSLFKVQPDYELNIMKDGQDLFHITSTVLERSKQLFSTLNPSLILVQGDTTTAMATSLAAFYLKIPIGHVEAGLRTASIWDPYPEEVNRRFVATLAQLHFAPTALAAANLLAERIDRSSITVTGNTIVDALRIIQEKIKDNSIIITREIKNKIDRIKQEQKSLVLITTHRRESFDGGIDNIFAALKEGARQYPNVLFYYPMHPNPAIKSALKKAEIDMIENIIVSDPISYQDLVYVLLHADFIATDSGGICEEAVSLGKQTLILRKTTERPEAIYSGFAQLVGTETDTILKHMKKLIIDAPQHRGITSPFGDGYAAEKITEIIRSSFHQQNFTHTINTLCTEKRI